MPTRSFPRMSSLPQHCSPSSATDSTTKPIDAIHPVLASVLPAIVGLCATLALNLSHADLLIADWVLRVQGGHWSLMQSPVLEQGLHQWGKLASASAWLAVLALLARTWLQSTWRSMRRPLAYLAISIVAATVAVSLLKKLSGVDCTWDLARYGGTRPYVDLLHAIGIFKPRGGCFPAGHASAGYAWISLYFFFRSVKPRWKWAGLAIGSGAGLAFGIAQQFRGAHFASHDVMTFTVCWLVASLGFHAFGLHRGSAAHPVASKVEL